LHGLAASGRRRVGPVREPYAIVTHSARSGRARWPVPCMLRSTGPA